MRWLESKEGMNSPGKSHLKRLFLNTWDDLNSRKRWTHPWSPMWRDCSWTHEMIWIQGRNELTQEVPCEEIVSEHMRWLESKERMNSTRKSHVKRWFLNTWDDLNPRKGWTHPGSPIWRDCFWTHEMTWTQGRNELTQEVPCEEMVSEHMRWLESKEGMNSTRKSHLKRLFLNTSDDLNPRKEWMNSPKKSHVKRLFLNTWDALNPRKEWTHPGSPIWRDCFWTHEMTWTQGRNELTQEVPCEEIVSEHMRWLESKEGMNSPKKSHVKRLFLNTWDDLNPRKGWTHPGSPIWRDCFWTHEMTWTQGRNELNQEVPCEEIVSKHMRWLESKEGMNSPRKSHLKRLFLNTRDDLNPRKEWTHPRSPMWRDDFWTHEMTWIQGRNELTQAVPCEEIVSEHMRWLESKEWMNSPKKSHVKRLFLNAWDDLNPRKEWTHPGSPIWRDCFWKHEMTWTQGRNELTQEVPCEEIVS